jgi:NAD+-dependent protein deacetylase sirtuin 4
VLGWPRFQAFAPNPAHGALARLEAAGLLAGLITQNVDRLHQKAGHARVLELHGSLFVARCLGCGATEPREALQTRLLELNPGAADWAHTLAPDGDADIPDAAVCDFVVPGCVACAGVLKPDVVFFGDNVPKPRVDEAFGIVERAEALLVVGSSLTVYSGYRFALRAAERKVPLCIVNLGPTRADGLANLKLEAPCGALLPELAAALLRAA